MLSLFILLHRLSLSLLVSLFILLHGLSMFVSAINLQAQLFEDLLFNYNRIPRPVKNSTDMLTVHVGASLIRIIDVDEKNQVLTTNLWLEMQWYDAKLTWNPDKYGGLKTLHIPSEMLWTPDLVLYNNAAGDPDITIFTDALVSHDGHVFWQPPAIYKSFCPIDVTWFPYDSQECNMKFGTWTYTGFYVDLKFLSPDVSVMKDNDGQDLEYLEHGMDLSFFYRSAEWDLLSLTSQRHSVLYSSCCGPEKYVDITFYYVLRRKSLFFTCNLIIPCFLISILTTCVFYLSDHIRYYHLPGTFGQTAIPKILRNISRRSLQTSHSSKFNPSFAETYIFNLHSGHVNRLLSDIMPPTSLVIPMFGRYLITTMILVALSTMISVVTVNFRFRSGSMHQMSPWIRRIFLSILPKLLMMKRPTSKKSTLIEQSKNNGLVDASSLVDFSRTPSNSNAGLIDHHPHHHPHHHHMAGGDSHRHLSKKALKAMTKKPSPAIRPDLFDDIELSTMSSTSEFDNRQLFFMNDRQQNSMRMSQATAPSPADRQRLMHQKLLTGVMEQVRFIANHFRHAEHEAEISDDWTFIAMVLDRLFLIVFSFLNVGTFLIILEAPSLYDRRQPLNMTVASKPLGQANIGA